MNVKKVLKNKLVLVTLVAYAITLVVSSGHFTLSFLNTSRFLKEMLLVMPVIFMLTVFIDIYISKETIIKHMGEGSGIKGAGFSILLGSLSAGPIYAAFPIVKMLLAKGASVANIVVILSAWAVIKAPMLANELKFLGPKFMLIRWVLTVISIYLMGYVLSLFVKKEEIPQNVVEVDKGLSVMSSACIGCGVCVRSYADYFVIIDKKAIVSDLIKAKPIPNHSGVLSICPTKAIVYR